MNIIDEIQQEEIDRLLSEVAPHDKWHVEESLQKSHRYLVQIFDTDFDTILINSSTQDRELDLSEYPSVREVIDVIANDNTFLSKGYPFGKLSGLRVNELCSEFIISGKKPKPVFLVDRDFYPGMNPRGQFYVRDGMHRIVAYGLATKMNKNTFPISGYYSTNKRTSA